MVNTALILWGAALLLSALLMCFTGRLKAILGLLSGSALCGAALLLFLVFIGN